MSLEKVVFFYNIKISMFVFGEHTVIKKQCDKVNMYEMLYCYNNWNINVCDVS